MVRDHIWARWMMAICTPKIQAISANWPICFGQISKSEMVSESCSLHYVTDANLRRSAVDN